MQFVSSWATEDQKTLLHFLESPLRTFSNHIQISDIDCEAGGILLGSIHGTNLLIELATAPTVWDKRSPYFFERTPLGHERQALAWWSASEGTIRYLGEWHTHPQDYPRPSCLDRSEWNRLSGERLDKRPLLTVIVGRRSLYIELVPRVGKGPILGPIE